MIGPDEERRTIDSPDSLPADTSETVRAIVVYWAEKRHSRAMPRRADFDPMDLPRHLPGIILLDVEGVRADGKGIYRYRVVGGHEVDNRGHNPTGRLVEQGFYAETLESAVADYEAVRLSGRPLYAPVSFLDEKGRRVREDSVLLPFSEDGEAVTQILVYSERREKPEGEFRF